MNKRIRKKKEKQFYKGENFFCDKCDCFTEWYKEVETMELCPSCFAEYVGLDTEEVWRCVG